jgi:hypothetical protein
MNFELWAREYLDERMAAEDTRDCACDRQIEAMAQGMPIDSGGPT